MEQLLTTTTLMTTGDSQDTAIHGKIHYEIVDKNSFILSYTDDEINDLTISIPGYRIINISNIEIIPSNVDVTWNTSNDYYGPGYYYASISNTTGNPYGGITYLRIKITLEENIYTCGTGFYNHVTINASYFSPYEDKNTKFVLNICNDNISDI